MTRRRTAAQRLQQQQRDDDSETAPGVWLTADTAAVQLPSAAEQSFIAFRTITALQEQQQQQQEMARKRNGPTTLKEQAAKRKPTAQLATSSSDDEDDVFEAVPMRAVAGMPKTPPPAATIPSAAVPMAEDDVANFVPTKQNIRAVQMTRRSNARNVLDALRKNQIPGYDDNDLDDLERDVVIDRDIFKSFAQDSAAEFQAANKPPSAPSVPAHVIDKVRTWEKMEILSELDQRERPWYPLAREVAGNLGLQLDSIIVLMPGTASAQSVRPTRSQTAEPAPFTANVVRDVGIAGISDALAQLVGMTPARDGSFAPQVDPRLVQTGFENFRLRRARAAEGPDPGSRLFPGLDELGSFLRPPSRDQPPPDELDFDQAAPPLSPPRRQPGEAALSALTDGQIDDALIVAAQNVLAGVPLAKTGARFRELREADRKPPQWYETGDSLQARTESQARRAEGARARAWIARPLATGVFYLNPSYTSARNRAYTQITRRAFHLSTVPMRFFGYQSESGTVQFSVFTQFAQLIADIYRLSAHGNNRSSKLASDAANYAASIEATTQFFETRITFDPSTGEFSDTGPDRALNRRKPWQSRSFSDAGQLPATNFMTSAETNPFLVQRFPCSNTVFAQIGGW